MNDSPDNLCILWTADNRETALNMVFMYGGNAQIKGWWKRVRLIVWGPTQPLLLGDEELQAKLQNMAGEGVELFACRACAENYGVADRLEALGLTVIHTGAMLTDCLKSPDWRVLSV